MVVCTAGKLLLCTRAIVAILVDLLLSWFFYFVVKKLCQLIVHLC